MAHVKILSGDGSRHLRPNPKELQLKARALEAPIPASMTPGVQGRSIAPGGGGGRASMASSIANLCNTIIGTGMLATPGAFRYTGLLPGLLLILLCGFTAAAGLTMLVLCADTLGGRKNSFYSLAMKTLPRGARWFDVAIAVKCFGVSISYLIICGQLMPQVVLSFAKALDSHERLPDFILYRDFWIFCFMVVLAPLCFLRRLDSLRHTSYLSLMAVIYLVLIVLVYTVPHNREKLPPPGPIYIINLDGHHFVSIFPIFVFAFTCAQNMLPVHNEMGSESEGEEHLARTRRALSTSISLAASIYMLVGGLGYLSFGANVGDNIITRYPSNSLFVCFGRLAIVILTFCSYPLQVHPCRAALDKVFAPTRRQEPTAEETAPIYQGDHEGEEEGDEDEDGIGQSATGRAPKEPEMSLQRLCILTCLILMSTFIISLIVDDLGIILGFVGSVGSTTISFILPGILFATLHKEGPRSKYRHWALLLAAYGFIVMVLSLAANIVKVSTPKPPAKTPPQVLANRFDGRTLSFF